jgi:hypothetical protein
MDARRSGHFRSYRPFWRSWGLLFGLRAEWVTGGIACAAVPLLLRSTALESHSNIPVLNGIIVRLVLCPFVYSSGTTLPLILRFQENAR